MEPKRKPKPRKKPSPKRPPVAEEIRALEEKLDRLIEAAPAAAERDAERTRAEPEADSDSLATPSAFDFARDAARALPARRREHAEPVDDFGYDPAYDARARPLFDFLYARYFRVECRGIANVPNEGRCMLVANHSGTIPFDGPMLKMAALR
mgnify:FL=1